MNFFLFKPPENQQDNKPNTWTPHNAGDCSIFPHQKGPTNLQGRSAEFDSSSTKYQWFTKQLFLSAHHLAIIVRPSTCKDLKRTQAIEPMPTLFGIFGILWFLVFWVFFQHILRFRRGSLCFETNSDFMAALELLAVKSPVGQTYETPHGHDACMCLNSPGTKHVLMPQLDKILWHSYRHLTYKILGPTKNCNLGFAIS